MQNHGSTQESTTEKTVQTPSSTDPVSPDDDPSFGITKFRRALPQILASSAKNLILMDLGMTIAFPTIVIPALLNNKTGTGMTFSVSDASWFGSIAFICQPVGSILSGIILEPLGRKCSLLVVNFPHIVGWLIFYFATTVRTIFIANIILGLGVGFMEAPIITYVGEICEPRLRGILISYSSLFFSLGMVFITGVGNLTDWQTTALISTLVPIITVIAITQVPETPYWLLSRGRLAEAEKSLCWLRGWVEPRVVQKEFQEMVRYNVASRYTKNSSINLNKEDGYLNPALSIEEEKGTKNVIEERSENDNESENTNKSKNGEFVAIDLVQNPQDANTNRVNAIENENNNKPKEIEEGDKNNKIGVVEYCKDLMRPEILKPLALVVSFFFVINFAGIVGMRPYQVKVYQDLGFPIDAYRAMVVMSMNAFIGTVLCMVFVRYLGKRLMSLISLSVVSTCLFLLTLYAKLNVSGGENDVTEKNWYPFVVFFILQFFFSFGVSSVPWMLVSEVFPYRGRSQASGFSAACSYVFSFLATNTFLGFENEFTLSGTLFLYATISLLGFIGMYIYLPETEGRTLEEIEQLYNSQKKL